MPSDGSAVYRLLARLPQRRSLDTALTCKYTTYLQDLAKAGQEKESLLL